jgi:hypothetical protein
MKTDEEERARRDAEDDVPEVADTGVAPQSRVEAKGQERQAADCEQRWQGVPKRLKSPIRDGAIEPEQEGTVVGDGH